MEVVRLVTAINAPSLPVPARSRTRETTRRDQPSSTRLSSICHALLYISDNWNLEAAGPALDSHRHTPTLIDVHFPGPPSPGTVHTLHTFRTASSGRTASRRTTSTETNCLKPSRTHPQARPRPHLQAVGLFPSGRLPIYSTSRLNYALPRLGSSLMCLLQLVAGLDCPEELS